MTNQGTILVVEDNPVCLKLLVITLAAEGYQVLQANSGELALTAITTHPPELILLDISLPGMDGFAVLRWLKARTESRDIPTIFVSGLEESEQRVEGFKLGAVDFIAKPFQREELVTRVRAHLELGRLRVRLEQQAADLQRANEQLQTELAQRRRAEEELRLIQRAVESTSDAIGMATPEGAHFYHNEAFTRMFGFTVEELSQPLGPMVAYADPAVGRTVFETIMGGKSWNGDVDMVAKDGRRFPVDLRASAIKDKQGRIMGLIGIHTDITERKLVRDRLELQSAALDAAGSGIVITNREGIIEWVNPAFTALTGYSATEAIGKTLGQLIKSGKHAAAFYRDLWETILAGHAWQSEITNRRKDGSFHTEHETISSVRNERGEIAHFIGIKQDVTLRRQAEEILRESQAGLARAESFSHIMVVHLALDGRWLKVPPLLCQLLDRTEPELLASRIQDSMHPMDSEAHWQQCLKLVPSDVKTFSADKQYRNQSGQSLWFETNVTLVLNSQGEPERFLAYLRDITESHRSEEKVRAQAALLDFTLDAIMVRDLTGRMLFWNKGAEKLYGWTAHEVLGENSIALSWDPTMARTCLVQTLQTGQWSGELEKTNKSAKALIVQSRWTLLREPSGLPQSMLIVETDITEKKQAEAQFLRSQRLENVGRLASGIAHDLNNILAPILMAAPMLREKAESDGMRRLLNTIESSALRGANIVKQVLAFGRGIEGQRAPLQPRHLLREMAQIIQETFPKSIRLRTLCPHDLWTVIGDATQLHQVLMNLCVNARDAMPQGGALTLAAGNVQLDATFAGKVERWQPGPYVLLTVTDTGTGISPENLDRIFEPFFTTKPIDLGTGLGLSTVFGIVKSHGGVVLVASTLGQGTQFSIYLPATDATPLLALRLPRKSCIAHPQQRLEWNWCHFLRALTMS